MASVTAAIDEKAYLTGIILAKAIFEFGAPEFIEAYHKTSAGASVPANKPAGDFLGVVNQFASDLQKIQSDHLHRTHALTLLKQGLLEKINRGDLMALGYAFPRNLKDQPVEIPADIFIAGKIHWEKSELKFKNMEFTGIKIICPNRIENTPIKKAETLSTNRNTKNSNFADLDPELHISEKEAAKYLGISARTLQGYRVKGGGPQFLKLKKAVRYKIADLMEWSAKNTKANTSA